MKTCSKCKTDKEFTNFYKDKGGKFGFRSICKSCDIAKASTWNKNNLNKHRDHQKKWREENRQESRDQRKKYTRTPKGKSTIKFWHKNNPTYLKEAAAKFRTNNPGYQSYYTKLRRDGIKIATPDWLTTKQLLEIRKIYQESSELSKSTGKQYHVDHIMPLVMKDSSGNHIGCGLHVPWNLQILTAEDNLKKKCKV